jgi:hypothetical protein
MMTWPVCSYGDDAQQAGMAWNNLASFGEMFELSQGVANKR